jgi:hypothetical protein
MDRPENRVLYNSRSLELALQILSACIGKRPTVTLGELSQACRRIQVWCRPRSKRNWLQEVATEKGVIEASVPPDEGGKECRCVL